MESQAIPVAAAKSPSDAPSNLRLVIRVRLLEGPPPGAVRRRLRRGALLLVPVIATVLLGWAGISLFRTEPAPVKDETPPQPATETAETRSAEVGPRSTQPKPVAPEVREPPDASPSPIDQVIPDVPRSARQTIRGTVRVAVRVIVDKEGRVLSVTADDPGPSRYFKRLALEAAKKWTFTPGHSEAQRTLLLRFNFTRAGTTAGAQPHT